MSSLGPCPRTVSEPNKLKSLKVVKSKDEKDVGKDSGLVDVGVFGGVDVMWMVVWWTLVLVWLVVRMAVFIM